MKKRTTKLISILLTLTMVLGMLPAMSQVAYAAGDVAIDATNFPDANFREFVKKYDENSNGYLSEAELAAVTEMDCHNEGIADLEGIEHFTDLTALDCGVNQLTTLDVSANTALTELWCYGNNLTTLDVSANTALTELWCGGNQLTTLDVSANTALTELVCFDNNLTELDVSKNTALTELWCGGNQLTTLDVSANTALTELVCYGNQLTTLDVSAVPALKDAVENGTKDTSNSDYDNYSSSQGMLRVDKTVNILTDTVYYNLWVNGVRVNSANKDDILGDGKVSYTPGEGAGTLTITGTPAITGLHENALIYADGIDLTINAASGLTLNSTGSGVYVNGDVTINGDASINTTGISINCSGDVTITGSLTATAEGIDTVFSNGNISIGGNAELKNTYLGGYGLCAPNGGITVDGDITVNAPAYALYAGSGTIRINGDANLNTSRNPINCSGDVTITGSLTATAEGNYTVFSNGSISIGGNAELKNTYLGGYGLCAPYGKITMTSGVWDITAGNYAIYAKNGIEIPSTHEVTTPTGGKIAQVTEGSDTFYTVTEADGTTVAKHAIIEPMEALTYTVTFDANGGTGSMADVTGISGEYTLPANGFTAPEGKQFKAWSVNSSEKAVGDTITVNANTTVTAIWEAIEYNVTVTGGTASVGAGTPITKATMGTTVTLTAGAAPSGQMFDKWVVNGVVVADANSATTTFTMPANNVTAQATYKDIPVVTYTVSFDANGGSGTMTPATGVSGDYVLPVCGFTAPNGKQFKAWSVGGVEKAVGDKITVTADTTVTAVWETIPAGHTCDIKPVAKVEPSCTEGGKEAYYKCEGCGKFYEDALGAKEITDLAAWGNLEKLGHTESGWKSDKDNHWKECTVAGCGVIIENSKAAHKDDNNDGKCDVCEYNVGTANKPSDDVQSPQTGDNSMMWLWVALLFVSGFGVVATTVYGKKRSSTK